MKKVILPLLVAILLVGGGVGLTHYKNSNPDKVVKVEESKPSTVNSSTTIALSDEKPETKSSVDIALNPPINGVNKGVIEVGASVSSN